MFIFPDPAMLEGASVPLDPVGDYSGIYAPEGHDDNVATLTATTPPTIPAPTDLGGWVAPAAVALAGGGVLASTVAAAVSDASSGLTAGVTAYTDPALGSGSTGLPGPAIPTAADSVVRGVPAPAIAPFEPTSRNGSTPRTTAAATAEESQKTLWVLAALGALLVFG